ncbi:MAG: DUF456 domain-containing protein [Spirochaetia bacterium]|nr:DUF456 domain-containing protein [Spirochaetia bacterium]
MDILLTAVGFILVLVALIGCVIPIFVGPPLAWVALLLLHLTNYADFSTAFLVNTAAAALAASVLDNVFTFIGAKQFGGTDRAIIGSLIGSVAGLFFFPPLGFILGAFLGAFIGEATYGKKFWAALKVSAGTFIGFMAGTVMKIGVTFFLGFWFFKELFFIQ